MLTALNEVGGEPDAFGRSLEEFHAANLRRRAEQPLGLAATATHDTKRGEDTRARIAVLSELPDEWRRTISRWARTNAANRTLVHGLPAPDRGDEYLFYQSLVGIWPSDLDGTGADTTAPPELIERLCQYMTKATKEAKVHTSWITPSAAYDDAVTTFVRQTLAGRRAPIFLASFVPFARTVARLGAVNALAQLVLKTVAPGVSDFYQGTELWDLTLVDPDNRQPIDFGHRRTLLAALEPWLADMRVDGAGPADPRGLIEAVRALFDGWTDGRVKLALTACAGRARRARPDLFLDGEYLALAADGAQAPHVVACARQHRAEAIVAVVSRWNHGLTSAARPWPIGEETWTDTRVDVPPTLAGRTLRNLLTGERFAPTGGDRPSLAVGDLLRHCPIALLWAESGGNRVS